MIFSSQHTLHLSPNVAVISAALGLCLIFIELNRPGRILPGAVGLLTVLLAAGAMVQYALRPWAVCLLLLSAAALIANTWRPFHPITLGLAALGLAAALRFLSKDPAAAHVGTLVALLSGLGLGALGAFLSRAAHHARRLKAVD